MRIEPNVLIGIAASPGYGFKFYKPERAAQLEPILAGWSKCTKRLGYSDYSIITQNWFGMPMPPGLPLMKETFRLLKKYRVKAVSFKGVPVWGYGAAANYVIARMLWDPGQDPDALHREFLNRAYGRDAASCIERFVGVLESAVRRFIIDHPRPDHSVTYDMAKSVYAPRWKELEKLYTLALARPRTQSQRKRLQMLGDNMVMAHWHLGRAGLIGAPRDSVFYRSDQGYRRLLRDSAGSLAILPIEQELKRFRLKEAPRLFAPENRTVVIPFLPAKTAGPNVDGDLSDPVWRSAAVLRDFRRSGTRSPATDQTEVKMLFDRSALYLGAVCKDRNMAGLTRGCTKRDDRAIFRDDTLEIFIGHRPNFAGTYWHIALNAANAVLDNVALDRDYNIDLRSATRLR